MKMAKAIFAKKVYEKKFSVINHCFCSHYVLGL